ncbi:MAG: hypothetical protein JXR37_21795 [Kiritimatiellae bacterium]|nr:hypothetical protein [Kiritimatiellia bacterium]
MQTTVFANPGAEYRGVTLWMLNDRLEPEELRRQLRQIHEAGIGAVITRTFNGLRTEYLSDEWMERLRLITDLADELEMRVFFQAGYMPSAMERPKPEYAHTVLSAKANGAALAEGETLIGADDSCRYVASRRERVLDMFNPAAVRDYLKSAYEDTWFARFGDQFGKTIRSIWVDEPHFNPPHLPWGPVLTERFQTQWGYSVEAHVAGLFRRTGDYAQVRYHYWRTVTDLLRDGYFDQVSEWCDEHGVAFSGHLMGEDTLRAQIAYTGACMPLYEKMHIPGIDHLTMSLNWSHWHRQQGRRFVLTPKQCSSAANQFGRKEILAEMYGVSTQGITFEDRKWIADWFYVLGINTRCLHGTFYSMRGRRKRVYVPHLSYQQPWWPENRLLADYCARVSYALRQGQFKADILVLHPVESAWCGYETPAFDLYDSRAVVPELKKLNDSVLGLSEQLMMIHRGFEYGDESIMARCGRVCDGRLHVGEMSYRVVILPDLVTLRRTTLELLTQFVEGGGTVLAAGELPTRIDGVADAGISAFHARLIKVQNTKDALRAALDTACTPDVELESVSGNGEAVFLHEREIDGDTVVFLANTSRTEHVAAKVKIKGCGRLEQWDCATGRVSPLACETDGEHTVATLSFPPAASRLIRLDRGQAAAPADCAVAAPETRTVPIQGPWRITRRAPNALTLDFCRLRTGGGEFGDRIPVVAVQQILEEDEPYEGPITLRFEFEVESVPGALSVVVEDADQCTLAVNGMPVSYAGAPYFIDRAFLPVDITEQVKAGRNTIDLTTEFKAVRIPEFILARLYANVGGTEIEPVYLIGDFGVRGDAVGNGQGRQLLRYRPPFTLTDEPDGTEGDLVADGYPFFAGSIELSAALDLAAPVDETVRLRIPGLRACVARVSVNGHACGATAWPPYEVDITDHVKQGANAIAVTLTNTLRNLLGPHHRGLEQEDDTWSEAFSGRFSRETRRTYPLWYANRDRPSGAWTDDYTFAPFGWGVGPVVVRASSARSGKRRTLPRRPGPVVPP